MISISALSYRVAHTMITIIAVLSLLCTFVACAQENDIGNTLHPNVVPAQRRHVSRHVVHIKAAPPVNVQLERGAKLVLKCEVLGRPSPTVHWMKNGEPILDYEEDSNDILSAHPSSAATLISQLVVTTAATGDVFTCVATSGVNRDSATTTVFVVEGNENLLALENLFELPSKPVITTYYDYVFQNIGTDLMLPCRVESPSNYQTFWEHNMDKVMFSDNRMQVQPSGDLLVTSLRWSDMGNFTCIVKNLFGSDVISTLVYPIEVRKRINRHFDQQVTRRNK